MTQSSKPKKRLRTIHGPTPAERRWSRILEAWRKSDLPGRTFCKKRGVRESAFRFWLREIPQRQRRRGAQAPKKTSRFPRQAPKFIPVRLVRSVELSPAALEVALAGGRAIRVSGDFDPAIFRKVVDALEAIR